MTNFSVKVGSLTTQLRTIEITSTEGAVISTFLSQQQIEWDASVRVNTETVSKDYVLQPGDVITIVNPVIGGR